MKKLALLYICMVHAACMMAQTADSTYIGTFSNEEHKIYLKIDLTHKDITAPGQDVLGKLDGFIGSTQRNHVWAVVSSTIRGNTATLDIVNNYGSEDFQATLTPNKDGSLTFKHLGGSTLKFPVRGKWQKIPSKFILKQPDKLQ